MLRFGAMGAGAGEGGEGIAGEGSPLTWCASAHCERTRDAAEAASETDARSSRGGGSLLPRGGSLCVLRPPPAGDGARLAEAVGREAIDEPGARDLAGDLPRWAGETPRFAGGLVGAAVGFCGFV